MSAEASALHAALDDERDAGMAILADFLPGELRALKAACFELADWCDDTKRIAADRAAGIDPVAPPLDLD